MQRFHVSGLYEGLFVMRDEETSSEWLHYTGECIVGPRAGRALEMVTTTAMTWQAFRASYPDGTTIPLAKQLWRRLMGRIAGSRGLHVPLPRLFRDTMGMPDERLPDSELGLGVFIGKRSLVGSIQAVACFYPFTTVRAARLIQDELGGVPIAVHYTQAADTPIALVTRLDDARVDLEQDGSGRLRDRATGSSFDALGRALDGPLAGRRLPLAPSVWTRWYGFSQTYPRASIWRPGGERG